MNKPMILIKDCDLMRRLLRGGLRHLKGFVRCEDSPKPKTKTMRDSSEVLASKTAKKQGKGFLPSKSAFFPNRM